MIRLAVVGTNWITQRFVDAAHDTGKIQLIAVYSRTLEQAVAFGVQYQVAHFFDSLEKLAQTDLIDAVYIASPNSLHAPQTLLFLNHKKHVICEKPLASNLREVQAVLDCARANQVILLEAFMGPHLPNFLAIQKALPKLGRLRKVFFNYCQYSSRYPAYLAGEHPNTFNPAFSNGSIMDIGYYCLATAVALWGEPKSLFASASLLESGVDAHGTVCLNYGDFEVVLVHSKVSNSMIPSEIQGEDGTLTIGKISQCLDINFIPREGVALDINQEQCCNTMQYEAETFADLIAKRQVEHRGIAISLIVAELLTEIRRQTGVIFPADMH
ncbi:Gfo/Idh/MocA family oxidoreductase [Chitinibacter bivalviorum]|uniref:Gfo/Idh/MocA family oxidoreductase n=1 Tax=Chitinibacter bivalviorum TaxID=2739434 RepID=A0A7H9BHC1_9NEIS|nr:Gfo/Idh/MocA family oxidoreductase [Chitinibacter bivalviorum]QLG88027.1 Gfo/Idh/MocA family oxidoreductase [Chitinibacter bivalviorum]